LKGLYQNCTPGPGSPCYAGGDGPDILDDIKSAGLTANNELFSYNQDTYMTESTMQTLWNSWGGGTVPRMVNGEMVSFTPSGGDGSAFLRIWDGECPTILTDLNEIFLNELATELFKMFGCPPYTKWQNLASFKPPTSVINRLSSLQTSIFTATNNPAVINSSIQHLENAFGAEVNLDYFPIKINTLPSGFTPSSFFEYFRLNITVKRRILNDVEKGSLDS